MPSDFRHHALSTVEGKHRAPYRVVFPPTADFYPDIRCRGRTTDYGLAFVA